VKQISGTARPIINFVHTPFARHSLVGSISEVPLLLSKTEAATFNAAHTAMSTPKDSLAIGQKRPLDQRLRIERHREFIRKLERDGPDCVVAEARRLPRELEVTLSTCKPDIHRRGSTSS
jgi:hypothetical protein